MRIEASTTIERPISEVWRYLADPSNNPKWDPGTLEVRQTSAGPLEVGTALIAVVKLLGRRELGVRITGLTPDKEVGFTFVSGPVTGTRVRYGLERLDGSRTMLTRSMEPRLSGVWRVLWPLVAWSARRHRSDEVLNVKRILEAPGSVGHPPIG